MSDPVTELMQLMQMQEAIASTAMSHDDDCDCDVCRAVQGDEEAQAKVLSGLYKVIL